MDTTVESIIEGVSDFIMSCPLLAAGAFRVDALGSSPTEYAIEVGVFDPIVERYVDGSSERRYQFTFTSRETYTLDRIQNMDNSSFYEAFAGWVEDCNASGTLPELPQGMNSEQLSVLSSGYLFDESGENARYQIELELLYFKEA